MKVSLYNSIMNLKPMVGYNNFIISMFIPFTDSETAI